MPLDEFTSCAAVAEWAGTVTGVPAELRFTNHHLYRPAELPDVVAMLEEATEVDRDDDFPIGRGIQQARLAIFDVELSMMVEIPANEEEAATQHDTLKTYAKQLRESRRADPTLGGLVPMSGRAWRATIDDARELPDETVGPALIVTVRVAELIDA